MKTFKNFLIGFGTVVITLFAIIGTSWSLGYCLKILDSSPIAFESDFGQMIFVGFICLPVLICVGFILYGIYGLFADLGEYLKKKLYKR
jgi:hypothetical protein